MPDQPLPIRRRIAVVAAHPDDEGLWFSSVLGSAETIILCYEAVPSRPDWTTGRRAAVANYPLSGVESLGLTESEAFNGADWRDPSVTEYGLQVQRRAQSLPGIDVERYRDNFDRLVSLLRVRLRGFERVYTHNPWGEYGHEEHVQVYRAVRSLQQELGFELWFDNYCSNKSSRLMLRYVGGFDTAYEMRNTDSALSERLADHYKRHRCWTWFDNYRGFSQECFMPDSAVPKPSAAGRLFPLNYIKVQESAAEPSHVQRAAATVRSALTGLRRVTR